jgi:predicted dehydrogenase
VKPSSISRRTFHKSAVAAALAPTIIPARAWGSEKTPPPSERINVGLVGLGGLGMGHVGRFLQARGTQVVAVCDVHKIHYRDEEWEKRTPCGREAAKAIAERYYGDEMAAGTYKGCDTYVDFRELCARDDIDVVVIATPDHWHARITLEALRNNKDVYCEKPVTHLFREGQLVAAEVAKRKAIFQTGSQQRSMRIFRHSVELVQNGHIGKLLRVEVGLPPGPSIAQGNSVATEPPENLDYDLWCGPSQKLPYMRARHHRWWRWHRAYGGGNLMDWIGHHNDIAHWGIGMERSGPVEVDASSGWTWAEFAGYNTPVQYDIRCHYANGLTTSINSTNKGGVKWIGEDGWIWANRGGGQSSNTALMAKDFDPGPMKAYESKNHVQNFLDGVRTRTECVAPAEIAHRSITPGHLGFVAQSLGRKLPWDPDQEVVVGDDEANALLNAVDYRAPWTLEG